MTPNPHLDDEQAIRYEDELVRRADGWRFSSRTFTARYLGAPDLSSGALPDRPVLFPLWADSAVG
jgi:hypothetical protein